MRPGAASGDLLYVAVGAGGQSNDGGLDVFTYPRARFVGMIQGFGRPGALCTDLAQNIWVSSQLKSGAFQVTEYAHGGTTPITSFADAYGFPVDCKVDPTTGDLAIANETSPSSGQGNVTIYQLQSGVAITYMAGDIFYYYTLAYDPNGNLFVVGNSSQLKSGLAELPHGGTSFMNITLKGGIQGLGIGAQWSGAYLVIGQNQGSAVYRYSIAGTRAILKQTISLLNQFDVGFWIQGNTLIGGSSADGQVYYYPYPKGGSARKVLTRHIDEPGRVALSFAQLSGHRN